MPRLRAGDLRSLAQYIFEALQVPSTDAAWVAEVLVQADLVGHDSHGVICLAQYAQAIRSGLVRPRAICEAVEESPSMALINGHGGLGQVVARHAMALAIRKAQETSISSVSAYNLYHVGRLGDYTRMAAQQDLVGIMMGNDGSASSLVAPFGGTDGRLGTNPLSMAFPVSRGVPFVLDMATSVVSEGQVRIKHQTGEQVPEGWLLDHQGRPTTDSNALYQEPRGALLPLGDSAGHKGFGLAMVVEMLSGILAHGGCASQTTDRLPNGIFMIVIDISAFVETSAFHAEIDELLSYVKSAPLAPGVETIMYPGEPEAREQQRREREGIPLTGETWQQVTALAQELGIPLPTLERPYS
jgi:hydroxycarboxylate dehydrogenase B